MLPHAARWVSSLLNMYVSCVAVFIEGKEVTTDNSTQCTHCLTSSHRWSAGSLQAYNACLLVLHISLTSDLRSPYVSRGLWLSLL